MLVPVIVTQDGETYTARCRHPVELASAGASRFEAARGLEDALRAALGSDVEVMVLEADAQHPWIASAGSVPDDELTDAWLAGVAEYRRQRDADDAAAAGPAAPPAPAGVGP